MAESMDLLIEKLLKMAGIADDEDAVALPNVDTPAGAFAPSPLGQVTVVDQSVGRGASIDNAKTMPYATVKSNTTPGQGKDVHLPDDWFEQRGDSCEGYYWAKRLKPPDKSSKSQNGKCSVCKRETAWYCFGCNRYLCNIPPQQGASFKKKVKKKAAAGKAKVKGILIQSSKDTSTKDEDVAKKKKKKSRKSDDKEKKRGTRGSEDGGEKKSKKEQAKDKAKGRQKKKKMKMELLKKYPRRFFSKVPVVKDGKLVTEEDGMPAHETKYGEYTCYHIAHLECWKRCCHDNMAEVQAEVMRQTEKAEIERKRKEEEQQQSSRSKRSRRSNTLKPNVLR